MINKWPKPSGRTLTVFFTLSAFFIVLFWRVLFRGEVMIGGDAFYYSFPLRTLAFEMLKNGELPLWLPTLFGGYPLFAMSQLGLAYPLTWGYLVLPPHWAEQIYVASPFLLGSIFTYLYARQLQLSHSASLLAALSFAYGGYFLPSVSGTLTHAAIWLPVMLIAIERSQSGKLFPNIALFTAAYALSILNGSGQGFVYVGLVAVAYGLSTVVFTRTNRYKPVLVVILGGAAAAGLTAFQTLETWEAVRHSIRQTIPYDLSVEGSYSASGILWAFIAPRFNMVDVSTFVPLFSAVLGISSFSLIRKNWRVGFWILCVAAAFLLMLGGNTPVHSLVYRLPVVSLFRVPARHAFEWTFGISILSAFGWDFLLSRLKPTGSSQKLHAILIPSALILGTLLIGVVWFRTYSSIESTYIAAKVAFTIVALATAWFIFRLKSSRVNFGLGIALISLVCFVEASILFSHFWYPTRRSVLSRPFLTAAPATNFLKQFSPSDTRVYTDGPHVSGHFDSFNLMPYFGVSNVAGYETAMLTRFSRALGDVGPDTSHTRNGFSAGASLFEPQSHVLDLLNTGYVTTFWDLGAVKDLATTKDEIDFAESVAPLKLKRGESATFPLGHATGDSIAIVTSLGYAGGAPQDSPVATIEVTDSRGEQSRSVLKAGIDSAEWAHERPDIRNTVPHKLALLFDTFPGDERNSFPAHRYLAKFRLKKLSDVAQITIRNTSEYQLSLWKLSVFDSTNNTSNPVPVIGPERWQTAFVEKRVAVIRNNRAMPRAWLVGETRLVTSGQALQLVRASDDKEFNPRETALVEAGPDQPPVLKTGAVGAAPVRTIAFNSSDLEFETESTSPAFLVISEAYYPGWIAEVDGKAVPIYPTNYLLRGIYLENGGKHRVVMRYTAPAARRGLLLAVATLVLMSSFGFVSRIRSRA